MPVLKLRQAPSEQYDYDVDWNGDLKGEAIAASTWELSSGAPLDSGELAGVTKVFIGPYPAGTTLTVTNKIETDSSPIPRRFEESFVVEFKKSTDP